MSEEVKDENVSQSAKDIIKAIKEAESFGPFGKSEPSDAKNWAQWQKQKVYNIELHYEIIDGSKTKDGETTNIYAEFHAEPPKNYSLIDFDSWKNYLESKYKEVEIIDWRGSFQSQGAFAIRYGQGVAKTDEKVFEKLSHQMQCLYNILGGNAIYGVVAHFVSKRVLEKQLNISKQVILTGAPGTGKTYLATEVAKEMTEKGGEYKKVQFHPGYDYSDFIIGLKPKVDPDHGQVTFEWKDGVFKEFSDKALETYIDAKGKNAKPYIFIIDEINRADLSRVFGEVFSLLEEDYRFEYDDKWGVLYELPKKEKEEKGKEVKGKGTPILLPNNDNFILPPNLYIIGTMNDIDRSVESMDFALRRRFSWKEVTAESSANIIDAKDKDGNFKIANENHRIALKQAMAELNKYIGGEEKEAEKIKINAQPVSLNLGTEYQLGGAYFLNFEKYQDKADAWDKLWNNHIAIILNEYLRGHRSKREIIEKLHDIYNGVKQDKNGKEE